MLKKICCILFLSSIAFAKPIKVRHVSDLNFGQGVPGDPVVVISAGTVDNASNGSFDVEGDANTAYTIVLPSAPEEIQTGNGSNRDTISIYNFTSYPAEGANGLLNTNGDQLLLIGATRAALRVNQKAGVYDGSFSVTVVY